MMKGAPRPRFETGRVLTISIGHVIHDTYTAFLAPLLPLFIRKFALSKTEAGLLSLFIQAPSLLQPLIGHLADRTGLRYVVILSPAIAAVTMSLLGTAPSYGMLAILLLVAGISSAALHAVGPVIVGSVSGERLGRGMGFWMVGGELGRTIGPIIIVSAVGWLTLEGTTWLMIGGLAASAMLFQRLRSLPGHPASDHSRLPWPDAIRAMRPLLLPLAGIITARVFMLSALQTYLPTLLNEEGSSLWFGGMALTILEAAGVAGALLGGSISDRFGRRAVLFASMLTAPFFLSAFLWGSGWIRIPLLMLIGVTALSVTPVVLALIQESFPRNRALANGVYMSMSFGLRSVVVVLVGIMGDLFGLRSAFAASCVIMLLGVPLIMLLPYKEDSDGSVS